MSSSALTLNQYNRLKKIINTKYGGNGIIRTEDILQESYLKLLERKANILDPSYVMNTAKYVVLNTVSVYRNRERLNPMYEYFLSISKSDIATRPDLFLENYKDILDKYSDDIKRAMAIPDKTRYVLCITTGEVFRTSLLACKAYGMSTGMLSKHLAGKKKSAGRYKGLFLKWRRLTNE